MQCVLPTALFNHGPLFCVLLPPWQIARHLQLELPEDAIAEMLPLFSFQYMKEHKSQFQPKSVGWKKGYEFIRKGKVGDHANLFGEAHATQYAEMLRKVS